MKTTREENGKRINDFGSRNKMNVFIEIYQINQVDLARAKKINKQSTVVAAVLFFYFPICCILFYCSVY